MENRHPDAKPKSEKYLKGLCVLQEGLYELVNHLGEGDSSNVSLYKKQGELNEKVAIKKMKCPSDEDESNLYLKEARRLRKLKHDFLPNVDDVFKEGDYHYMVMEYVEMDTLQTFCESLNDKSKKDFVEKRLKKFFLNLLEVIFYIHKQGVMHLDLKPDNILIDGDSLDICLIDFELSRGFKSDPQKYDDGLKKPVHRYTAPEQIEKSNVTYLADIYALGGVLFYLSHGFIDPPRNPYINKFNLFEDIIFKCMQESPDDRFLNANDLKVAFLETYKSEKKPQEKLINKKKRFNLKINSNAKRARLRINDEPNLMGTPLDLEMFGGEVKVVLFEKGYETLETSFILDSDCEKHFDLIANRGLLSLTSEPSDIRIKLNSNYVYTPIKNFDVKKDDAKILIEEEGFDIVTDSFSLLSGDVSKHYVLKEPKKEIIIEKEKVFEGMSFSYIKAGEFMMGSPEDEADRFDREGPEHKVKISKDFYMQTTQMTQKQWFDVMQTKPSDFEGDNRPVESVSFDDIRDFLKKINERVGFKGLDVISVIDSGNLAKLPSGCFRLPTEAEWEYCCRAGISTVFSFGNSLDSSQANFNGNYPYGDGKAGTDLNETCDVKSYKKNAFGLYDMHGNVDEWVQDYWDSDFYSGSSPKIDPVNSIEASYRVFRGGGWANDARILRSAYRYYNGPDLRSYDLGFRLFVVR